MSAPSLRPSVAAALLVAALLGCASGSGGAGAGGAAGAGAAPAPAPAGAAASSGAPAAARGAEVSAPIGDVRYDVTYDERTARTQSVHVAMTFTVQGPDPVLLSIPEWTPGAYELSWFARWVTSFAPAEGGRALDWDKVDYDTWRLRPAAAGTVTVAYDYQADTLDNAMAWSRPDFLLFNGTNLFFYPEGRDYDWGATVAIHTEPGWLVATGMTPVSSGAAASGSAAGAPATRAYAERSYHDLVDMPFFVGRFDLDSLRISGHWVRFASYPSGFVAGRERREVWDWLSRVIPPEAAVFGVVPWSTYTVMQIADSAYGGGSGLEHQNSHVDVITPLALGNEWLPSLYAHEIFHSWNVKRLRPADMWPYAYGRAMPTPWLWVSEGITDYYADLAEVRGGVTDSAGFFEATSSKINQVDEAPPVALEDASLSTWVHPVDGTGYLYYPKGSLAGLALDILIRDASDDRASLDSVMRHLYHATYEQGRGFTADDFWGAVRTASGGRSYDDFARRYVDGREPFPWDSLLALAGMRIVTDTSREPHLGLYTMGDTTGLRVMEVESGSSASEAGVRVGDYLLEIGGIDVTDEQFGARFHGRYGEAAEGTSLPIRVRRDGRTITLAGRLRFQLQVRRHVQADPHASAKAVRIRSGILRGRVEG